MADREPLFGLVGNASTGKDFVAGRFVRRGFSTHSGSDILREIIVGRGLTPGRELQTRIANEVRRGYGEAFFVQSAIARARQKPDRSGIIITGLYAPAEAAYMRSVGGLVIGVVRPGEDNIADRYAALRQRADGSRDALSYEEFLEAHRRENSGVNPDEANVQRLIDTADYLIVNDGKTTDHLDAQIDQIIEGGEL